MAEEGFDIYHLSFYACRSGRAADSKSVRVIADTTRDVRPGCDVVSTVHIQSRVCRRGRAKSSPCDPFKFSSLQLFSLSLSPCFSFCVFSLEKAETLDPSAAAGGASLRKSCRDSHRVCVSFQSCTVSRADSLPFLLMASLSSWTAFSAASATLYYFALPEIEGS